MSLFRASNVGEQRSACNGWFRLLSILAPAVVIAGLAGQCHGEGRDVTVDEIKQAWAARQKSVGSFMYRCDVTEDRVESATTSPFESESDDEYEVRLSRQLEFKWGDGGVAFSLEGDWPDSRRPGEVVKSCKFQIACDGKLNRDLLTVPTRSVPHMGSFKRIGTPQPPIAASSEAMPIWMWFDPVAYLKASGHDVDGMTLSSSGDGENGLLLITVPRGKWTAEVLVDSKPPFSPKRLSLIWGELVMMMLTMNHVAATPGHDSLASWEQTQTTDKGWVQYVRSGVVKEYRPNQTFSDADFVVKYPVGAHLVEFTNDKDARIPWIQATETEMRRLDSDDYGKPYKLKAPTQ